MNLKREAVVILLNRYKSQWPQIAKDMNIAYSWLSMFTRDKIPNPGYETIEALHDYLLDREFNQSVLDNYRHHMACAEQALRHYLSSSPQVTPDSPVH